ncbi:hypothetical protein Ahy_B02g059904 isoform L [Arachis hypogaea]|uniref:Uncharacterized protein n=1 Tax=Arachis hypogaea TaxID=3818 RepID=A0A445AHF2_ARAHY|nr:hypothetical protein Ahy_B02g059904 isoform L [Arachis hypogaea]
MQKEVNELKSLVKMMLQQKSSGVDLDMLAAQLGSTLGNPNNDAHEEENYMILWILQQFLWACYTYKLTSLQVGLAKIQVTRIKRDYMERHLHVLNTQTVTYGKLFHFFHFSKRFENKETLPFSSENQSSKYTSHCSKPPLKHHQTLHQESEEKTKQQYSTENGSKKPNKRP